MEAVEIRRELTTGEPVSELVPLLGSEPDVEVEALATIMEVTAERRGRWMARASAVAGDAAEMAAAVRSLEAAEVVEAAAAAAAAEEGVVEVVVEVVVEDVAAMRCSRDPRRDEGAEWVIIRRRDELFL